MKNVMFTPISGNAKTGPIPVSGSNETTCPNACPFKKQGCYAKYGPIAWHWARLNKGSVGITWAAFLLAIGRLHRGTLWRHNQFGDLAGVGNAIDGKALAELTAANRNKTGFTYTHKPVVSGADAAANRAAIKAANAGGFVVNLSGNSLAHADSLKALGIAPVVCVVPEGCANTVFTPAGNKVIVCPAQSRENVTCSSCRLCANQKRSVIVGFRAHGMGAKYVRAVSTPVSPAVAAA